MADTMEKHAFTMKLNPGMAQEYKRRHDEIWGELVDLLREAGVRDYSIFLEEKSNTLFGVMWRSKDHTMDVLPEHPVMKRWWSHMADLMATNVGGQPFTTDLRLVFHME
ncbi:MAG: L-rhamnose mutarotase [Pseudorhizobium sp.]